MNNSLLITWHTDTDLMFLLYPNQLSIEYSLLAVEIIQNLEIAIRKIYFKAFAGSFKNWTTKMNFSTTVFHDQDGVSLKLIERVAWLAAS